MSMPLIMKVSLIPSMLVLIALFSYYAARKKVLMCLLSLELILLNMFLLMIYNLKYMGLYISPSFYLLVLGACEASIALSILITMTRFKGNDMLTSTSMKY